MTLLANNKEGSIIATKVTLGGRLCTTQDVNSDDKKEISETKREVRKQRTATLMTPAGEFDQGISKTKGTEETGGVTLADKTTRMTIQTQGGNSLMAAR